jgi:Spy/CpxP family protein refolding chaperone
MTRKNTIITAAVAMVALAAAGLSLAHPPGSMGYGPGAGMGYGMGPGMGGGMGWGMGPGGGWMAGADAGAPVSGRLATLKSELKITSEQEKAWNALADQSQQQFAAMQSLREQMRNQMLSGQSGPASPEMTATREAMFKLRQAGAEAHAAKLKELYAVLTPEQKALADQRFAGGYGPGYGWQRRF